MNTLMILEQLPPKGVKREQAILELGKDEANGELLFQLVNTEKGKCKTAAQKALDLLPILCVILFVVVTLSIIQKTHCWLVPFVLLW